MTTSSASQWTVHKEEILYTGTLINISMRSVLKERTNHQTKLHIEAISVANKAKGGNSQYPVDTRLAGSHKEIQPKFI